MSKILSQHNLSQFGYTMIELREFYYCLDVLTHLDETDIKGHEEQWYRLVCDMVSYIGQHITDLDILYSCLCREVDINCD